jgi:hypothetical protein
MTDIEIEGLDEAIQKYQGASKKLERAMRQTMNNSLLVLHENVPPYPSPPEGSTYRRTGTLGRTLGSGPGGGVAGKPDIYQVTGSMNNIQGAFGTRLNYAPYVISDDKQARMHKGRWFTMSTIADRARAKITKLWNDLIDVILK